MCGAWVIAVGIAAANISPALLLYFDPLPADSHDSVEPYAGLGKPNSPLTRVLRTLTLIKTAYASSGSARERLSIQAVIDAVTNIYRTRTESNVYSFIAKMDLHRVVPITFSGRAGSVSLCWGCLVRM